VHINFLHNGNIGFLVPYRPTMQQIPKMYRFTTSKIFQNK